MTGAGCWPTWPARLPTAAEVISDFRVMDDQGDLFGLVASVPTAWRTLDEIASGGDRAAGEDHRQPLWWTLRRPFRQLTYHAALRMFTRAGESLGKDWTLHDLRHTAAYQFGTRTCRWLISSGSSAMPG